MWTPLFPAEPLDLATVTLRLSGRVTVVDAVTMDRIEEGARQGFQDDPMASSVDRPQSVVSPEWRSTSRKNAKTPWARSVMAKGRPGLER